MSRQSIQQLSAAVINKIAAGEVIERPASVVKELVENAIDAGATRIDVSMQQGGAELIRVVDNGHGIPAHELPLAVASHATSKIRDADDLFRVGTMGFRGEALASISQISEFRLRSRIADADAGAELEILGGAAGTVQPCGCSVGTTVEVRRLFFNTPVRRKFMRTPQTEMGHATEALTRVALAHPGVHFTLHSGPRTSLDLPPVQDARDRIASCFGSELAADLIHVESQDGEARIAGYVANPKHSRSTSKHQYLFLNRRHIRDRALQHALSEAYRGLLLTGRHPIAFLDLSLPADAVDVNVHPTKLEVRFQDGGRLYSQLLGMLRNRFLTTDLTAKFDPPSTTDATTRIDAPAGEGGTSPHFAIPGTPPGLEAGSERSQTSSIADNRGLPWAGSNRTEDRSFRLTAPEMPPRQAVLPLAEAPRRDVQVGWDAGSSEQMTDGPSADDVPTTATRAMQVHNRYLVTASDDGIVVIDQHALHERILYEQLREKVLQKDVEKQRLLVPEPVRLTPVEASAILQAQSLLSDLGIDIEDFGGDTVLLSSYPAMLANFNPAELVRQLADQLSSGTKAPDRRDLLDELLHMISCKAAIKAGDRLSPAEIEALIGQRHLVQDSHHCPHGRPTTLVFTEKELDHRFQRT